MHKQSMSIMVIIMIIITYGYSADSLTVTGKVVNLVGNGVQNATIITEEGTSSNTNVNGEYVIKISKNYLPIEGQDIIFENFSECKIKIYNILGHKIFEKNYVDFTVGNYIWNGVDQHGKYVSSGIYFPVLEFKNKIIAKSKVTIIGGEVLNNRPFVNSIQNKTLTSLAKRNGSKENFVVQFDVTGDNFANISNLQINVNDDNNDDIGEAENIEVNIFPIALFTITPDEGRTSTIFYFDASGSSDTEDALSELQIRWDWENDNIWDTEYTTTKIDSHQFNLHGNYSVKLEIKDTGGELNTMIRILEVEEDTVGTVSDFDGNIYKTVKIGNQWWMAENLKVTHYRNGDEIAKITDNTNWANLSAGAYCNYNNEDSNVVSHGNLYNWYTVNNKYLAPEGWHMPSDNEWDELINFLGDDAATKLKSNTYWNQGTDNYGFSVIPSGFRHKNGEFYGMDEYVLLWSSSVMINNRAASIGIYSNDSNIDKGIDDKLGGYSVRCIKGSNTPPSAYFEVHPSIGPITTEFAFDASATNDIEDINDELQIRWDWENDDIWDTQYTTTKTATHQYTENGSYTIVMEVIDSEGSTDIKTDIVHAGNLAPVASFTVDPEVGTINTVFAFDASGSSDIQDFKHLLQVRWDWTNDGIWDTEYTTTKTATHQYSTNGSYTIMMEVKDTEGLTDTISNTVFVGNTPPNASFTITPENGAINTEFLFKAYSCSDLEDLKHLLQVRWDWKNDGIWDTEYTTTQTATYQYTSTGTYKVALQVKDTGGLTDTTSRIINVINTPPIALFTVEPEIGNVNTVFDFDASESNDLEDNVSDLLVRWDWENNGIWDTDYSTNKSNTHQYAENGTFYVTLEVKDTEDSISITTNSVHVGNTPPTALFSVSPDSGILETIFTFDASGCNDMEDNDSELQVKWDWENDGVWDTDYSTEKSITHQYIAIGDYTVILEVKDSEGAIDTTSYIVKVNVETDTVTDIDGNVYKSVKIGNQWWIAENLKVTHYRNGNPVPKITDVIEWENLATGSYCNYNFDDANADIYGNLYSWHTIYDKRNIAPIGWHIPTDEEWDELKDFIGSDAGKKLKSITGWMDNDGGTNDYQFSGLPGGCCDQYGGFSRMGYFGYFWTSTGRTGNFSYYRQLYGSSSVRRNSQKTHFGFSVRCIKGELNTPPTPSFTVDPSAGTINTDYLFDASGCSDIEDDISTLQVRWDWENDGTLDTDYSNVKTAVHQYTSAGIYSAAIEVMDSEGALSTQTQVVSVDMLIETDTVTDIDGNIYTTVKIGNQWWMTKNLKVTHYRNGDPIPKVTDNTEWMNLASGAYCIYNNYESNADIYGMLYNWYSFNAINNIAPEGWHIPTDAEWEELVNYLGTNGGVKLKAKTGWFYDFKGNKTGNGTDDYGFSALPVAYRYDYNGNYSGGLGGLTQFWSATEVEDDSSSVWIRKLVYIYLDITKGNDGKTCGFPVRCIKD